MEIPAPEPGLVVAYSYLWHEEHRIGREEGSKTRPAVVVLTVEGESDQSLIVVVLPVTHVPPIDPTMAVEIPNAVKRHLGLDDQRSWIIVSEGNEFVWPGYDLRKRPKIDRCDYGFLPPALFKKVREAFVACHKAGKGRTAQR